MSVSLLILLAGLAIVAIAVLALTRRGASEETAAVVAGAPPVLDYEGEARLVPRDPEITWPKLLTPTSALDEEARLRLINDLALVRAPWCVPILQKAFEEEQAPANRDAALAALKSCEPTLSP